MNKRRLLKLADLLEADAENKKGVKFDLRVIAVKSGADPIDYGAFRPGDAPQIDCGTTACAIGLACLSGAFRRSGLTYTICDRWGFEPKFEDKSGMFSAELAFFGIDGNTSSFLFQPGSYPQSKLTGAAGERFVAKRIRDFVAGKVAP